MQQVHENQEMQEVQKEVQKEVQEECMRCRKCGREVEAAHRLGLCDVGEGQLGLVLPQHPAHRGLGDSIIPYHTLPYHTWMDSS